MPHVPALPGDSVWGLCVSPPGAPVTWGESSRPRPLPAATVGGSTAGGSPGEGWRGGFLPVLPPTHTPVHPHTYPYPPCPSSPLASAPSHLPNELTPSPPLSILSLHPSLGYSRPSFCTHHPSIHPLHPPCLLRLPTHPSSPSLFFIHVPTHPSSQSIPPSSPSISPPIPPLHPCLPPSTH